MRAPDGISGRSPAGARTHRPTGLSPSFASSCNDNSAHSRGCCSRKHIASRWTPLKDLALGLADRTRLTRARGTCGDRPSRLRYEQPVAEGVRVPMRRTQGRPSGPCPAAGAFNSNDSWPLVGWHRATKFHLRAFDCEYTNECIRVFW